MHILKIHCYYYHYYCYLLLLLRNIMTEFVVSYEMSAFSKQTPKRFLTKVQLTAKQKVNITF